jgi:DNA modification methylase
MPESVTDRFSKKHEYFFFMTKSTKYYFDLDSIRDKVNIESVKRSLRGNSETHKYANPDILPKGQHCPTMKLPRKFKGYNNLQEEIDNAIGKNPGSVSDFWDIPTKPSSKNHYAAFNEKLIEKPIMAGCPKDGIILDPFCGTATTLLRAYELDRKVIGVEGSEGHFKDADRELRNKLAQTKLF